MGSVREPSARHARGARTGAGRSPVTAGHGFDVALNPATIGALMAGADRGSRERLIGTLQRIHGNAAVGRLVADGGLPLQRWAVKLAAGTKDCAVVVSYLDANSPYKASSGWAQTKARFSWGGDPAYTTSGGATTATVSNPTVTKTVTVDMPTWAPTDPTMKAAWTAMTADLRAHEAKHEAIATTWEATLKQNLAGLTVTVPDKTLAAFKKAVQAEWDAWLAQHQADQTAIDPYTAVLDCSGGEAEASSETGAGATGSEGSTVAEAAANEEEGATGAS